MAKDKKSFILYCDQKEMFEHLPPELCKQLLLHIFSYVNDENPESNDSILNALFAPIKYQLKRDLEKWEANIEQRRQAGIKSAEVRKAKASESQRPLTTVQRDSTKSTDTVNVTVNVNEEKKEVFSFRKSLLNLGIEKQIVSDYLKSRKTKRATNSETAFKAIKNELGKCNISANESIKIAAENGWSGFKAEWINNLQNETRKQNTETFDNSRFKKHNS